MTENQTQNCGNCIFAKQAEEGLDCRRNPPVPVADGWADSDATVSGYWPKVDADGWCGHHKLKEGE